MNTTTRIRRIAAAGAALMTAAALAVGAPLAAAAGEIDNTAPITSQDHYDVDQGLVLTVAAPGVLVNDVDLDGDALTVTGYGTGAGAISIAADGSFEYTAPSDWAGEDVISYTVSDGFGASSNGTLHLHVKLVGPAPLAVNDVYSTTQGVTLQVAAPGVMANDLNLSSSANVAIYIEPEHGDVTLGADGGFTYVPDAGYTGADTFSYTVFDPQKDYEGSTAVTIYVNAVDTTPIASPDTFTATIGQTLTVPAPGVLGNDDGFGYPIEADIVAAPTQGTLFFHADGSFSYTPFDNMAGGEAVDTFTYRAVRTDNPIVRSATTTVTIHLEFDEPEEEPGEEEPGDEPGTPTGPQSPTEPRDPEQPTDDPSDPQNPFEDSSTTTEGDTDDETPGLSSASTKEAPRLAATGASDGTGLIALAAFLVIYLGVFAMRLAREGRIRREGR